MRSTLQSSQRKETVSFAPRPCTSPAPLHRSLVAEYDILLHWQARIRHSDAGIIRGDRHAHRLGIFADISLRPLPRPSGRRGESLVALWWKRVKRSEVSPPIQRIMLNTFSRPRLARPHEEEERRWGEATLQRAIGTRPRPRQAEIWHTGAREEPWRANLSW